MKKHDTFIRLNERAEYRHFDFDKDPYETHNAINDPQYAERIEELRRLLAKELKDSEEGYSDGEHLIEGRTPQNYLSNAEFVNC